MQWEVPVVDSRPLFRPAHQCWSLQLSWATLLVLLAVGLPLFLRMPLYQDVSFYDVGARNLLEGGIHYRDIADNNLPGMVWLHAAIRSALGWKSETLRLIDFLIVTLIVGLLMLWFRRLGLTPTARVWTAVVLMGFYLATSEVSHCQRDMWMLLPALA